MSPLPSDNWRDRCVVAVVNWIIPTFATRAYTTFLTGVINYGLNAAARDVHEGINPPKHWRTYADNTTTKETHS